ncbi:hypothetical protein SAMN06297129_0969 [Pseudooceanicola antarcticus]|uniref:Uncharacterized protein n=1 Tax=Pseudooceanicola antarcticus TaxID=1247613 RepID=A0A285IES5_9RHOB|nr:hypothetical protein [Pseudooceanicola antarcticus]SNY46480.1 hypothetical protein SAMN06297129_0969 [Pseudooceanicola antarcticus]
MLARRFAILALLSFPSVSLAEEDLSSLIGVESGGYGWMRYDVTIPELHNYSEPGPYSIFVSPQGEWDVLSKGTQPIDCPNLCPNPKYCICLGGPTPRGEEVDALFQDMMSIDWDESDAGVVDFDSVRIEFQRLMFPQTE